MKTFNLIKWLWTDSHEKQKPQRFVRYAAMLIMLLTLGVGQMWADNAVTVYCAINASTMKSGDNCYTLKVNANIGDNNTWRQYTMNIVDKTKNGKLIYSATIYEKYGGVDALQFQLYQGSTWKAQKQPYSSWTTSSTFSGKMYDYDAGSWGAYSSLDAATTVYFVNTSSWGTPKAFAWSGCTNNAAWSGQTMTSTGKTYNGKDIYSISFNKRFENIIFSNNGSSQTADQTLGSTNAGKMYDNGTWRTYNYDVTVSFNLQGHGSAIASKTVVKGSKVTAPSDPSASGYTFGGWYKEAGCTNAWNFSSDAVSADTELFAKWTENMSTVSFVASPTGKGTFQVNSSTVTSTTAGVTTTRSVTAVPISGYHFVSWSITGGASISSTTTNPTTVTGGGAGTAATLTATFAADDVYSLTVAAGTGISAVTGSTNDIKAAQNIAITATVATGYTWSTWTKTAGSGTLSTFTAGTKNQTVTVGTAGDITLTASATENMSTLTTSNHYDAGDPSYSAPSKSVSSIGISTTADLTAAAPGTGYTFAGWTLSSNIVVTSGNAATDRSITIRTNGNGAAATAQANYTEDLSSPYTIKGGTNITGNNWSTAYNMTKKSGHSTESVVYYTFNISSTNSGISGSADDWSFKVIKDGSTWYGLYASGSYWWRRSTSANQSLTGEQNIQICADVAGPYEIKVDYTTPASPKVTVTFPTKYTVTYSVSPSGAANAITTSPSVASGGSVAAGTSMTFTHAAAKTGYSWYRWENGSGSSLGTGSTYTTTINANTTVVAKYTENTFNVTATASTGGSATPASATSMGQVTGGDITASPNTGYDFTNWTITSGSGYFGTSGTATTSTTANTKFRPTAAATIQANFTPKQTTITLNNQDATTPGSTEVTATFDAAMPAITLPEKTGYTFGGYWGAPGGSGPQYYNADGSSTQNWDNGNATYTLFAKWTPKQSALTFDYQTGVTGYGSSGSISAVSATYDAAMPSLSGSMPTAAEGYAFMGFYDATGGGGTKYYNADGSSAHTWDKDVTTGTTLYAYYKNAEITALTLDAGIVEPEATVGVTPTISPTPTGTTIICWTILHNNGTPLDPQPSMTWSDGKLTFAASAYSGTYKVQAVLRTGNDCSGGTSLDTETASFLVAGSHTVTVNYKCGDDVIKTATSVTGRPTDWSDDITAPDIFGYTFVRWDAEDGVTIKNGDSDPVTTTTNATIQIEATYAGKLTAVYTQKSMIYFKNTLGWSDVYVNFYTTSDWDSSDNGSGSQKGAGNKNVTNRNKHMTQIDDTDIWYYDYGAASISPSLYVSFTSASQNNVDEFWASNPGISVVYPANYADAISADKSSENGFKAATPMFVPIAAQDPVLVNVGGGGRANYYNAGYWTKYTPGTGYRLEIYNNGTGAFIKAQDFTSADDLMPMKVTVDLEGGQTYKFQLRRGGESSAGVYYGNSGTMTYTNHGQDTPWDMTNSSFSMCKITTNAAGDYTFNLSYSGDGSTPPHYRLRIAVDYPVASGDYRLVYSDAVQTKPLTSAIVNQVNDGTDIVSFFVRPGSTPVLRIQQATVNPSTGAITWNEYPNSGTPTNQITGTIASTISSSGTEVYNFNLSMNGSGALTVASAEVYDGKFYIRTDAANSKWDNYRTDPDHVMTYSEYSITHGGFTHYYCHWVDKDDVGRKNVKFVIANDYSPNISDTLAREAADGTWANIDKFMEEGGDLKRSANVRFMWDKRNNTISRAYVDGAQGDYSTNFLYMLNVEDGADKIKKEDGTALTDHKITFKDNGNWMYEANIKAQPEAKIKLLSNWGTSNTITQYFRGASDATETLLGGSGSTWYDIRVIYDFKTNRLIAGLIPSGNISDPMAIHADVMFIREHQGDIAQVTFTEDGAITDIETAYGVLQFNKWTLNNKSKADGHAPLSPLLSAYERDLFYVSFPFKVAMEEVFGFGTYGQHWIIEEYDGASRAANGYWAESGPNWKFVFNRKNKFFEPGTGYIIALDLDEMGESADIWANTDQVELYFPSYGTMDNITSSTATYKIPAHLCTIDRSNEPKPGGGTLGDAYDRRVKDSHWNVLGVPTYVNPDAPDFANTAWTTSATETSIGPNFLYQWNMDDNSVSAVSASGYTYHAMHAYLVQYCGDVTWTSSVSVKPSPIVAREQTAPRSVEFRLELTQNDEAVDQTFVKLSDNETVTTGFEFNYDLSKEFNKNRANIYTLIGTEQVAGNVLPLTEQTTVVPVGVDIKTNGDYTFSIPDGTEGIGVTLIDTENNIRTSLSALSYTVNLTAGTHDGRLLLEIAPIQQTPTDIDLINGENGENGVRKMLIDQQMYIIRDGKIYDARGARVQ